MNNNFWPNVLSHAVSLGPLILVWIGGIVLAAVNWRRCPTSSLLVVLAMLDLALVRIATSLVFVFGLPLMRESWNWNNEQVARVLAVNGYLGTAGAIVGYVLLLTAVFIGRQEVRVPEGYGQFPPK